MRLTRIFCNKKIVALLLCLAMLPLAGCGESRMEQRQVSAMNTIMTLTAYGKRAEAGLAAAEGVITSMDAAVDPDVPNSTLYAINHANGQNVIVPAQLAKMLSTAITVYNQSGGALDPSIYPLVKRWGFVDGKYYLPTDEEISAEMMKLCYDKLVLTSFPSSGAYSVSLPAGAELTLAAVAKGCASENAIDAMRQAGVESAFISMAGNIQTLGVKPDGSLWTVGIQDPANPSSHLGVINVGETAVVTSGAYQERFIAMNGRSYHHILNPASGYPVNNSLQSVTIVCEDGTMADCLSTAMFVLGENKALNYWRTYGGFEMILINDSNRVTCTSGLIEKITLVNPDYTLRFSE